MDYNGKILVIDDEPDFIEVVKWQLELCSYSVKTASNGKEALDILRRYDQDILLADIRMPGMDGIELIQHALKLQPDLQCIVVTGHGGIDAAISAMRLGAINYLRKPMGLEELEVAVQKGMEKLELIRAVRAKQENLEKANRELNKLRKQLESNLEKEHAGREKAEKELRKAQIREVCVDVMHLSLRYWQQTTNKDKTELADESGIWTASLDQAGTYRTRTLDRYCRINTIPQNPRSGDVLKTAYFVLQHCPSEQELKERLERRVREFEMFLKQ